MNSYFNYFTRMTKANVAVTRQNNGAAESQTDSTGASRNLTKIFVQYRQFGEFQLCSLIRDLERAFKQSGKLIDTVAVNEEHEIKSPQAASQHNCLRKCTACGKEGKFLACQKPTGLLATWLSANREGTVRICRTCRTTVCSPDTSACSKMCLQVVLTQQNTVTWSVIAAAEKRTATEHEKARLVLVVCEKCALNLQRIQQQEAQAKNAQVLLSELNLIETIQQLKGQQSRIEGEIDILFNEPIKRVRSYPKKLYPNEVVRAEKQIDEQLSKLSTMLGNLRQVQARIRPVAEANGIPRSTVALIQQLSANVHTARSEAYFELRMTFHNRFQTLFKLVLSVECADEAAVENAMLRLEFDALSCAFVQMKQLCFELLRLESEVSPKSASCSQLQQLSKYMVECVSTVEEQVKITGQNMKEDMISHTEICDQLVREQLASKPILSIGSAKADFGSSIQTQVNEIMKKVWYELERRVHSDWTLVRIRNVMFVDAHA